MLAGTVFPHQVPARVARTFPSATAQRKPGVLKLGEGTGLTDHQPGPHAPCGPGLGPTSKRNVTEGVQSFLLAFPSRRDSGRIASGWLLYPNRQGTQYEFHFCYEIGTSSPRTLSLGSRPSQLVIPSATLITDVLSASTRLFSNERCMDIGHVRRGPDRNFPSPPT